MAKMVWCQRCFGCCSLSVLVAVVSLVLGWPMTRRSINCYFARGEEGLRPSTEDERLTTVHVVYATDWNGFAGAVTSMSSLIKHMARPQDSVIHLIVSKAAMDNATQILACLRQEISRVNHTMPVVQLHELLDLPFDPSQITFDAKQSAGHLPEAWVRILLADYLPEVHRVLWLDHDVIVQSDVATLYRMHMEHPLAAGWEVNSATFNSGVLLLDLDRIRKEGFRDTMVQRVLSRLNTSTDFADQDLLNEVFPKGSWDPIDWRWNVACLGSVFLTDEDILSRTRLIYLVQWPAQIVHGHCLQEGHILHLNCGPKYWRRPRGLRNCALVAPHALPDACLGWKFECEPT